MNTSPKITIITPSFNQGQYIEQTICSVLDQNYPNLEYIIIDGGSTDNTVEIIKKYASKLTYWVSEPDKGQTDAINKGLKLATGDIFNWLNSDDYYEPGTLEKIAAYFKDPAVNVVGGRSKLFIGNGKVVSETQGTDIYPGNLAKTIGWARIDQPETFFRKSAIDKIGLLDSNLNYLMDRDLWIKYLFLFELQGILKVPDLFVNFRLHEESKTVSQSYQFEVENDTYFWALAKTYNLIYFSDIIKKLYKIKEGYSIQNLPSTEIDLIAKVLNYFLLLKANTSYLKLDKVNTKFLLNSINKEILDWESKRLFAKLNFRNSFLPSSLIKLLRNRIW